MANNPIFVGYAWSQAFDFPDDFLQSGDEIRAEVRKSVTDSAPLITLSSGDGIEIDGNRVFVTLTTDQTSPLGSTLEGTTHGVPRGTIVTNFTVIRGGGEIPIGVLISIPVMLLPTRATT